MAYLLDRHKKDIVCLRQNGALHKALGNFQEDFSQQHPALVKMVPLVLPQTHVATGVSDETVKAPTWWLRGNKRALFPVTWMELSSID